MRRLTAWIGGVAGGVVAYRFWRRRSQLEPEPSLKPETAAEPTEPDDRAEELREKLAETRAEDEPSPPDEPAEPPEAVEERRQRVHEEGRATLDEMKSDESA
jgi:hypothetical protein